MKNKITFGLNLFVVVVALIVIGGSNPIGCRQDLHVPVPEPSDTPEPGTPPKIEPKPLPPVAPQK